MKRALNVFFAVAVILVLADGVARAQVGGSVTRWRHTHNGADHTGPVDSDQDLYLRDVAGRATATILMDSDTGNIWSSGTITIGGTVFATGSITTFADIVANDAFFTGAVYATGSGEFSSVSVNSIGIGFLSDTSGCSGYNNGDWTCTATGTFGGNLIASGDSILADVYGATGTFSGPGSFASLTVSLTSLFYGNIYELADIYVSGDSVLTDVYGATATFSGPGDFASLTTSLNIRSGGDVYGVGEGRFASASVNSIGIGFTNDTTGCSGNDAGDWTCDGTGTFNSIVGGGSLSATNMFATDVFVANNYYASGDIYLEGVVPTLTLEEAGDGQAATFTRQATSSELSITNSAQIPNSMITLNGSGYVTAGVGTILSAPTDWSVSLWVRKTASTSSWNGLAWFDFGYGSKPSGLTISNAGTVRFEMDWNDNGVMQTSLVPSLNTWYHVVATSDNNATFKIYVNGVDVSTACTSCVVGYGGIAATTFGLGYLSNNHKGDIDEVALYSATLSPAEVLTLYNSGTGYRHTGSEANLVGLWHFDDETGTAAIDSKGTYDGAWAGTGNAWTIPGKMPLQYNTVDIVSAVKPTDQVDHADITFSDSDALTIVDGRHLRFDVGGAEKGGFTATGTFYVANGVFASATVTNNFDMDGGKIVDVLDPVDLQDAATKNYVDTEVASIPTPTLDTVTTSGNTTANSISVGDVTTTDDAFIGDLFSATGTAILGSNNTFLTAAGVIDANYNNYLYDAPATAGGTKIVNGYNSDTSASTINFNKYASGNRGAGADIGAIFFTLTDPTDATTEFGRILVEAEDETNGDGKMTLYNVTGHSAAAAMEFSGDGGDINILKVLDMDVTDTSNYGLNIDQNGAGGGLYIDNAGAGYAQYITNSGAQTPFYVYNDTTSDVSGAYIYNTKTANDGLSTAVMFLNATAGNGLYISSTNNVASRYGIYENFTAGPTNNGNLFTNTAANTSASLNETYSSAPSGATVTADNTNVLTTYFKADNSIGTAVDFASMTVTFAENLTKHHNGDVSFYNTRDGIGSLWFQLSGTGNDINVQKPLDVNAAMDVSGDTTLNADTYFVGAGSGLPYGDLSVAENAVATSISAPDTWTQFVGFATAGVSNLTTPSAANDDITVSKTGVYKVTAAISYNGSTGDTHKFEIQKNNGATEFTNCRAERKLGAADIGSVTISCLVSLTAADTVELWALNDDDADDITIKHCNLSVIHIGG